MTRSGWMACAVLMGFMSTSAFAATDLDFDKFTAFKDESGFPTDEHFASLAKRIAGKSAARKIASNQVANDDLMSAKYKEIRARILALESGDLDAGKKLDALLTEMNNDYDSYPADLKFIAAQMIPIQKYKSFVWRMVPVAKQARATQEVLLNQIRGYVAKMGIFFPDPQWIAGFRYVTEAYGDLEAFRNEYDLQHFIVTELTPAIRVAIARLTQLDLSNTPVVWDNKLRWSDASFPDSLDRYRLIGEGERFAALARMNKRMYWATLFSAYRLNGSIALHKEIAKKFGMDSLPLPFSSVDGLERRERVAIVRGGSYRDTFTLYPNGAAATWIAYRHLRASVRYTKLAWQELSRNDRASDYNLVDDTDLRLRGREAEAAIENMDALTAFTPANAVPAPVTLRSALSGRLYKVNLAQFYRNPPQDLKALLPTEFEEGPEYRVHSGLARKYEFRNYFKGRAKGWNAQAYKGIFPEAASSRDVADIMKAVAETRGGKIVTYPLAPFVR